MFISLKFFVRLNYFKSISFNKSNYYIINIFLSLLMTGKAKLYQSNNNVKCGCTLYVTSSNVLALSLPKDALGDHSFSLRI